LPVVATGVGGVPELIEHGASGLLVPPRDPNALAGGIAALARSTAYREELGRAAERRVRDEFSFSAMVEKYENLYRRLIG
jgi:L-malate glycosyltransferase